MLKKKNLLTIEDDEDNENTTNKSVSQTIINNQVDNCDQITIDYKNNKNIVSNSNEKTIINNSTTNSKNSQNNQNNSNNQNNYQSSVLYNEVKKCILDFDKKIPNKSIIEGDSTVPNSKENIISLINALKEANRSYKGELYGGDNILLLAIHRFVNRHKKARQGVKWFFSYYKKYKMEFINFKCSLENIITKCEKGIIKLKFGKKPSDIVETFKENDVVIKEKNKIIKDKEKLIREKDEKINEIIKENEDQKNEIIHLRELKKEPLKLEEQENKLKEEFNKELKEKENKIRTEYEKQLTEYKNKLQEQEDKIKKLEDNSKVRENKMQEQEDEIKKQKNEIQELKNNSKKQEEDAKKLKKDFENQGNEFLKIKEEFKEFKKELQIQKEKLEKRLKKALKIPKSYICKITDQVLKDPVIVQEEKDVCCHSYEREEAIEWFNDKKNILNLPVDSEGKPIDSEKIDKKLLKSYKEKPFITSPGTGKPVPFGENGKFTFINNFTLKQAIKIFMETNKEELLKNDRDYDGKYWFPDSYNTNSNLNLNNFGNNFNFHQKPQNQLIINPNQPIIIQNNN